MNRKNLLILLAVLAFVAIDFAVWSQVAVPHTRWCWQSEWSYDPDKTSTVSIVRSDNPELSSPVSISDTLGYEQVAEMVEKAVELAGGFENAIPAGAKRIVIKPNLVDPAERGNGCVTDYRVVRVLVLMLYRQDPAFEISVAEGAGGWARPGTVAPSWSLQEDGYVKSGFKTMIESLQNDPAYPGLNLSWVDLNFDTVEATSSASPRLSDRQTEFYLPVTMLDADFIINVPVLKVHETGITVGLKNYVGVLPGMVYGWSKDNGYNGNGIGLDHTPNILEKNFVDIVRTVGCDFMVVDAIVGKERTKYASGDAVRRNMIIAGSDIVSVDAVSAKLMDINPDDVEHISLAALTGMGQNDLGKITVVGSTIEESAHRYYKAKKSMDSALRNRSFRYYGQSNRTWLLNGPWFDPDMSHAQVPEADGGESAMAGKNGWSQPVYFYDNLIDPAGYYQDTTDCVYYAFAWLDVPEDVAGAARLWAGSDGPMKVWINGQTAYDYNSGVRAHKLPNEVVNINLLAGPNSVLVKLRQTAGVCRFSLNICETESDSLYAGNRVAGVEFTTALAAAGPRGDLDSDGKVGIFDLLDILSEMKKQQKDPACDLTGDGQVNIFDLLELLVLMKQPATSN